MSGADSRRAAAELLIETLERRRTLDEALETATAFNALQGSDRAFARAMASAALRQLGRIDAGLAPFLNRSLDETGPEPRALLRVGAAQLWLMDTPGHAAVGETVAAAKSWRAAAPASGFLNAVLRRAASDRTAFEAAPALAVWPDWLQRAMVDSLGRDGADALAQAQAAPPRLHLIPKDGDAVGLAQRFGGETRSEDVVALADPGPIEALPGYADGDWWVQDAAAALPARLLSAQPGERVFDLCAAPGGKTLQLAAAGADVVAVDRSAARLKRLRENLSRAKLAGEVQVVQAELSAWRPDAPADKILLDAPCSALGTLRRHPEGAWIKSPGDVARYPKVQSELLKAAAACLKPGGTLVYCVCTPLRAEGCDVVDAAVEGGEFVRAPIASAEAPGFETVITPKGDALTLPRGGADCDAFYMARLRRTA
ncbi:MAG: RsmB/NOP family class I SAM-dependent RNA methyltransferase [Pseudomonadota bacterium]